MPDLKLVVNNKYRIFYFGDMGREELIEYCDGHRKTPLAKFNNQIVAQMIEYAGCPKEYFSPEEIFKRDEEDFPMHEDMKILIDLARERK